MFSHRCAAARSSSSSSALRTPYTTTTTCLLLLAIPTRSDSDRFGARAHTSVADKIETPKYCMFVLPVVGTSHSGG